MRTDNEKWPEWALGELDRLEAEVERLRANGLDWMRRYEAAVEHERAAEARLRKVEALVEPWIRDEYDAAELRAALAAEPAERDR